MVSLGWVLGQALELASGTELEVEMPVELAMTELGLVGLKRAVEWDAMPDEVVGRYAA